MTEDDLPSIESVPTDEEDWDPEEEILKVWGENWMEYHHIKVTSESYCPGLEAGWLVCELCSRQLAGYHSLYMHFESRNHRRNLEWARAQLEEGGLAGGPEALPAPDGWMPPDQFNAFQPPTQTALGSRKSGGSRNRSSRGESSHAALYQQQQCPPVRSSWAAMQGSQHAMAPPPPTSAVPPPPPPPPGDPSQWLTAGMPQGFSAPPPPSAAPPLVSAPPPPPGAPPATSSGPPPPSGAPPPSSVGPPPPSGGPSPPSAGPPPPSGGPPLSGAGPPPPAAGPPPPTGGSGQSGGRPGMAPADGTYAVARAYDGREVSATGTVEGGYLPLVEGTRVTLLSEAKPGSDTNRHSRYAFGKLPSGQEGWVPVDCLFLS